MSELELAKRAELIVQMQNARPQEAGDLGWSLCNTIFLHNLVASVFAAILTVVSIGSSQAMNGGTWYDNCSKWAYSKKDEIAASPVEKRLAYRECQIEAIKAWCDQGWEGDATNV
jgi:hypothetical protein